MKEGIERIEITEWLNLFDCIVGTIVCGIGFVECGGDLAKC